jgi:HlyD family secretion protein
LIAKDLRKMQVWVAVNEADIGKIHPGQPVSFTVSSFPGETFKGTVSKIRLNATMTQNVVTYIVEVLTDNSENRLLPFLTANVKFELKRIDDVMIAPNAALRWMPRTSSRSIPIQADVLRAAKEKARRRAGARQGRKRENRE